MNYIIIGIDHICFYLCHPTKDEGGGHIGFSVDHVGISVRVGFGDGVGLSASVSIGVTNS